MGPLFANIASNEETVIRSLIAFGFAAVVFAGLAYWLRKRRVTLKPLPVHLRAPSIVIATAACLAIGLAAEGPNMKAYLQQSQPALGNLLTAMGVS